MIIPAEREADVTGTLIAAFLTQPLETNPDEDITEEELEPPPFDLVNLGLVSANESNDTSAVAAPSVIQTRSVVTRSVRRKRVADTDLPVQCSELYCSYIYYTKHIYVFLKKQITVLKAVLWKY